MPGRIGAKSRRRRLFPVLHVCWACGMDQTDHTSLICRNDECMASLVPHRAHDVGVQAIEHLISPGAASRVPSQACREQDRFLAGFFSPLVMGGLLALCGGAAVLAGVPWLLPKLSPVSAAVLWIISVLLSLLTLESFVSAAFATAANPPPLPTGAGARAYLDALGPSVVQQARLCGACGTPQTKNAKGLWVVSHVSKQARCVWHGDHFCAVTGNIVAAGTYRPFLRFLSIVLVDMIAVWSLVATGWLLHDGSATPARLSETQGSAIHPTPSAVVWHLLGLIVGGDMKETREAANQAVRAVFGRNQHVHVAASLLAELMRRALHKAGLGVLAVHCGLEGTLILFLMGVSAAGGSVALGIGIPVLAAIGRKNGGKLAEGNRALARVSWSAYCRQVARGCMWWLCSHRNPRPPTWSALAAGSFDFEHDLSLLE